MTDDVSNDLLERAQSLVSAARKAGADAADVLVVRSQSLGVSWRLGKLEDIERSENTDLGLRVMIGRRQANISSTDLSPARFAELAERAVAMARLAPEDPYCGLADAALLATAIADLDLDDHEPPSPDWLTALSAEAEAAALSVKGVTNSEGAGASWSHGAVALATSDGFAGSYGGSSYGIGCSVVAGAGTAMERDYEGSSARHKGDLDAAAAIGTKAATRAVRRLNPRKIKSVTVPVIYDPRVSNGLVGHFAGAINGSAIARGVSFLKDMMGEAIFGPSIRIVDDPLRKRGARSKPFDGEGVQTKAMAFIEGGVLQSWVLDSTAARQLGLKTTGHAARGTGGPPGPSTTNLYLEPGEKSPEALIGEIKAGLYITDLIGMGVNGVTGDYSRGAAGFWIKDGTLAYPVSEITVAGNLKDMFKALTPANDLVFRYGTNAPTLRIDSMTIAGT